MTIGVPWARRLFCLAGLLVSLAISPFAPNAFAQYDVPSDMEAQELDEEQLEGEDEDLAAQQAIVAAQFELSPDTFDSWLYQNRPPGRSPQQHMSDLLELQLESLEQLYGLSDAQRAKLQLAGTGDIERYSDRVEQAREKFMLLRRDQNAVNQIWQDIQPLQRQFQQLFGQDSLFRKCLATTFNEAQQQEHDQLERDRRLYRYRAKIELALAQFEKTVPMTAEQRDRLVTLVLETTEPPKVVNQYEYYIVLYNMAHLSERELKNILDPTQFATLRLHLAQGRGLEQFLIQNGLVEPAGGNEVPPQR